MKKLTFIYWLLPVFCLGQSPDFYQVSADEFLNSEIVSECFTESEIDKTRLEAAIFHGMNQVRREHNLPEFQFHPKLNQIARAHSTEMAGLNYFSHQSPVKKNETLTQRFRNAKVKWTGQVAENIAVSYTKSAVLSGYFPAEIDKYPYDTYSQFAKIILVKWLESPGHRKNILNPQLKRMAIGVARGRLNGLDAIYVTQNFATTIH